MKTILSTLVFLLIYTYLPAQITITGIVRDIATQRPIADANVMLQNKEATTIYSYTMTSEDGQYALNCKVKTDSLLILVTGFNVRETQIFIAAKTQITNINVVTEALQIKEVRVKAEPIVRRSDTINYFVNLFTDQSDRTIGDVLGKMPGLTVADNGQISYNGKPINKFYIENLDMLEGRYGLATSNIQAKDIAKVQVYENHQPVKVLQGVQYSDNAAINLTLKEEAKNIFNAIIQLGGGYKPAMWNGELIAMLFSRKFQTLGTYKTNNSGNDISREFISHTDDSQEFYNLVPLQIANPTTPNIAQSRYLKNNIHTISFNSINRINQDVDIKVNALYIHDNQKSLGNSQTTYHLPSGVLFVPEDIYARQSTDKIEVSGEYLANTTSALIKNKFQVNGMWNNDFGTVITNNNNVSQYFKNPQMSISNIFSLIKVYKNMRFSIFSKNSFTTTSANLEITPLLYPDIFDPNINLSGSAQDFNTNIFKSYTSGFTDKRWGIFFFKIQTGYDLRIERAISELTAFDNSPAKYASVDSLQNHINWNQLKIFANPNVRYVPNSLFSIDFTISFAYLNQFVNDKVKATKNSRNKFLIEPSLQIMYKMSVNTSISAGATVSNYNGDIDDFYSGYIMNNYRRMVKNAGVFNDAITQNYNISISYGNAIKSLFGSLSVIYYHTENVFMQNINYLGELQQISSHEISNTYNGYIFSGKIHKRFDNIASTFGLFCTYRKSFSDLLRQNDLLKYASDYINVGVSANIPLSKYGSFDYNVSAGINKVKIENTATDFSAIKNITQSIVLNIFITKMMTFTTSAEHFYNNAIIDGSRSMFFVDTYFIYKTKGIDYIVEACNLTNEKQYKSLLYSDISDYLYSYDLRPISILFKVRFSLK
jgi:hypothetical protein